MENTRFRPQLPGTGAAVVFTGTRRVTVDGESRSATGGLVVDAGAQVQLDGLELVDVADRTRLPGGSL